MYLCLHLFPVSPCIFKNNATDTLWGSCVHRSRVWFQVLVSGRLYLAQRVWKVSVCHDASQWASVPLSVPQFLSDVSVLDGSQCASMKIMYQMKFMIQNQFTWVKLLIVEDMKTLPCTTVYHNRYHVDNQQNQHERWWSCSHPALSLKHLKKSLSFKQFFFFLFLKCLNNRFQH